ncbi:MAG: hypothetical protein QOJ35_236 [Solirubrobacteraceae bacterium]|jgi:hypothetical protein|nr:hypothetical protein [Solirubrobacteraceae bacterium]
MTVPHAITVATAILALAGSGVATHAGAPVVGAQKTLTPGFHRDGVGYRAESPIGGSGPPGV